MLVVSAIFVFPVFFTEIARGDILHVGPGQTYSTITAGIAAAVDGDTVYIHSKTYYESGIPVAVNISIVGEDVATTVIHQNSSTTVFVIALIVDEVPSFLQDINISNLTFEGTAHTSAIQIQYATYCNVSNCVFDNGSAVYFSMVSNSSVNNCTVKNGEPN